MPELAEVETLVRYLKDNILAEEIVSFTQGRPNLRYQLDAQLKEHALYGNILEVKRRAKFLVLNLSNNYSLVFHLGMSGYITVKPKNYTSKKHDHIILGLSSGNQIVFNDARRFGMVYSCKTDQINSQNFLRLMGPEPLTDDFNVEYLLKKLLLKKASIKSAIMDNRIVVGIGNIYAAESLFLAKINPMIPSDQITKNKIVILIKSIKEVLNKAINAGGTTLKDFVGGDGNPGYFKQELNVYGRESSPCYICKKPIEKIKQAGRSTFYCPNCQK